MPETKKTYLLRLDKNQAQGKRIYRPRGQGVKTFTCAQCGKAFEQQVANRQGAAAFCSNHCAALYRERAMGHAAPVTLPCSNCGQPVTKPASKILPSGNVFCDPTCYREWRWGKKI